MAPRDDERDVQPPHSPPPPPHAPDPRERQPGEPPTNGSKYVTNESYNWLRTQVVTLIRDVQRLRDGILGVDGFPGSGALDRIREDIADLKTTQGADYKRHRTEDEATKYRTALRWGASILVGVVIGVLVWWITSKGNPNVPGISP